MALSPNEIHFKQTNLVREQNLKEDLPVWKFILSLEDNDSDLVIEGINKKNDFKINYTNKTKLENHIKILPENFSHKAFFQERVKTLCKKIWNKRSNNYGLTQEDQISLKIIKSFAKMLVDAPIELQLEFCRGPEKQSINEKISFQTLKSYLNEDLWDVKKPANGEISVEDEQIKYHSGNNRKLVDKARSVDFLIQSKNQSDIEFYGFAKFSKDKGSGQGLQAREAKTYLKQCKDYCESNNDKKYFFCLIDGKEGSEFIKKLKPIVRFHKDRIFVGNSFDIIEEIKKNEK